MIVNADDVLDLAARGAEVHQLAVAEVVEVRPQRPAHPPLQIGLPDPPEETDDPLRCGGALPDQVEFEGGAHRWLLFALRFDFPQAESAPRSQGLLDRRLTFSLSRAYSWAGILRVYAASAERRIRSGYDADNT